MTIINMLVLKSRRPQFDAYDENAFVSIVQTRPCPIFGNPFGAIRTLAGSRVNENLRTPLPS
jgi:hypothetical protein